MKNIIFLLAAIFIMTSCTYSKKEKLALENQFQKEKKKVDSLQKIVDTLRTKFIFDNLTVLHIPNKNQPIKEGEEYSGKLYFVAFNKDDRILFSPDYPIKKPDTISKIDYGGFEYKTIGKKGKNNYYFETIINNQTSLNSQTGIFDGRVMSDIIISE